MRNLLFALVLLVSFARSGVAAEPCARIISLAPSITEVIFELGLGNKLVGVTRYCRYPPEAQKVPNIGGLYDVSLEGLLALKPTFVFALRENGAIRESAARFGVGTLEVDHSTVDGIKKSLISIAETCGIKEVGVEKVKALELREAAVRDVMKGAPRSKTLVVAGRTHEGSSISGVYVSGRDGFYSGVLEIVGLSNVNQDPTIALPVVSPEGLMALAPEVIIEVMNADDPLIKGDPRELWRQYKTLPAVRSNRIFMLREDYASIPGPRYILVAEELARKLRSGEPS